MSKAPSSIVDQAKSLVAAARLLPADEAAVVLEQVSVIAQAAQAGVLAAAERSGEIKDSGCRTVRSFVATILRRSPEDASQVARVAHHLVAFPKLAEAYQAGRVHTANMRAILAHLSPCGLEVLQAYEDTLCDLGVRAGPKEIHTFCRELAAVHKPDRERDKVSAQGRKLVRIHRVGDLTHLDAMVDPVLGDQLKATLAAMAKASRTPDDPRSYAERSADALEQVLRQGMTHPAEGDEARPRRGRPHATVSVQLETLLGMGTRGPAILSRFGLIPTATAARVTCDAVVRLVVKCGETVLNVGRSRRVVSPRQRVALAEMYQCCVVPGCGVRFADCEVHHLWWWSLAGPTDMELQVPVCSSHHSWLHEGGYTITREDDVLTFRDPKGRVIANIDHMLQQQLDLLHQAHPPDESTAADQPEQIVQDLAAWTDSRCRRGRWGWTGQDPGPPPGHAPPCSA